jgi:hypothetical protein
MLARAPTRCLTMDHKMRWPKIGPRVHVEWLDPAIYSMCELSEALPCECWTEGTIVKKAKDYVVLATSQYKDGSGDFTVLVKGCCTKITVMI